jgi:hypothetical protein
MMRRHALRVFPDLAAPASSDGASGATRVGSKVIGFSALGVALLAIVFVWASTVLMLLKDAAVLAFLFWIGATVWLQVGRDPWRYTAFGDKVRALTVGALRRPLLVTVLILSLAVAGAAAPAYLIPAALIGVGGTIGLRRLTAVIRSAAVGRHYRAHRCRIAAASGEIPDPIAPAKPPQIGLPEPIDIECNRDQLTEEPAELRISFAISRHADRNEAALLAIRAVTAMKQTRATQAPTCLQQQTADGGAILDIRFHVCDVRRGQEHVLEEAESRLWDLLHESRIPFAIRPRHVISRETSVGPEAAIAAKLTDAPSSNGGHPDCVIIPIKLAQMKHTRSGTL